MVSPGDFIPLFERNGFIVDLDAFVFEEACAYLASRSSRGLPPLRLSVNVSRLSIAQGDFLDRYSAIRDKYGIDSGMLELECTETMVIRNFALFRELMAALPSRGFRSAMDDFGTGYSSLNMLKEIALDVLKLDIAFFRDTEPHFPRGLCPGGETCPAWRCRSHALSAAFSSVPVQSGSSHSFFYLL